MCNSPPDSDEASRESNANTIVSPRRKDARLCAIKAGDETAAVNDHIQQRQQGPARAIHQNQSQHQSTVWCIGLESHFRGCEMSTGGRRERRRMCRIEGTMMRRTRRILNRHSDGSYNDTLFDTMGGSFQAFHQAEHLGELARQFYISLLIPHFRFSFSGHQQNLPSRTKRKIKTHFTNFITSLYT